MRTEDQLITDFAFIGISLLFLGFKLGDLFPTLIIGDVVAGIGSSIIGINVAYTALGLILCTRQLYKEWHDV